MAGRKYFIQNLTLLTWFFVILVYVIKTESRVLKIDCVCYVIDGSKISFWVAKLSGRAVGITLKRLDFRLMDVRDSDGSLISLRIAESDLFQVQQYFMKDQPINELISSNLIRNGLAISFLKKVIDGGYHFRGTMERILFLVQVCKWTAKTQENTDPTILFLERRSGMSSIRQYGRDHGVDVVPVLPALMLKSTIRDLMPERIKDHLRVIRYKLIKRPLFSHLSNKNNDDGQSFDPQTDRTIQPIIGETVAAQSFVAVPSYGQFNLDKPEMHSDLFFWQESSLPSANILMTFALPKDPVDTEKFTAMQRYGISAVALHSGAALAKGIPCFLRSSVVKETGSFQIDSRLNKLDKAKFLQHYRNYNSSLSYYSNLFEKYNAKVHLTWFKFDEEHYVISDAIRSVGGIAAIYQRSYQARPNPISMVEADVGFGYSQATAFLEESQNSNIRYHVATGFLGDHRFDFHKTKSLNIGNGLRHNGAKWIMAYFDENSTDDERWHTGHQPVRENYAFLLEKVIENPWFGLLIKPKAPFNLRYRLGPVVELLEKAESTGRCYVYEAGSVQGSHTPVEAAVQSDLAVHGHLSAGTAGIESALAGIPTLLLDREGYPSSPLYALELGRVVFQDWETLWQVCVEHWSVPRGLDRFGDWSPILSEMDPFRDGKAAERMGDYIKWLIEGYQDNRSRDTILADAAEKYVDRWGSDKIVQVRSPLMVNNHIDGSNIMNRPHSPARILVK